MRILAICALLACLASACVFNPPPEPSLELPEVGVFAVGEPLTLRFSEPIDPATLGVRIWPAGPEDRTIENDFVPNLAPALTLCNASASPCGEVSLEVAADGLSATLVLGGDAFSKVKVPWALEVAEGLADLEGQVTAAPYYFDFQFGLGGGMGGGPVDFDDGTYVLVGVIEDPLPAVLLLVMDIEVLEDGTMRMVGGKATPIEGAAKNTSNPDELLIDETDKGFAVFITGTVAPDGEERFLQTDPFDVLVKLGPIEVTLSDVRISGVVLEDTPGGQDRLEGTISFSKILLDTGGDMPFEYDAGNTTYAMEPITEAQVPTGAPRLCTDLCGSITAQCDPPGDFPGMDFCQ